MARLPDPLFIPSRNRSFASSIPTLFLYVDKYPSVIVKFPMFPPVAYNLSVNRAPSPYIRVFAAATF